VCQKEKAKNHVTKIQKIKQQKKYKLGNRFRAQNWVKPPKMVIKIESSVLDFQ